jgi:hypothetical protein
MQYQPFLKRSQSVDVGSHSLNFQSLFQDPFPFDDSKSPLPPASAQSQSEPHLANQRQQYRTRLIAKVSVGKKLLCFFGEINNIQI